MDQSVSERKVALFVLVGHCFSLLGGIVHDYSLGYVLPILNDSFSDNLRAFLFLLSFNRGRFIFVIRLRIDRERTNISLDCAKGLADFFLSHCVFANDPQGDSDNQVRFDLSKTGADLAEDSLSVLRVGFNHFSDKKDGL